MAIQGFERRSQIEATLRALQHEKKGCMSAAHLATIDQQIDVFTAGLERMDAEGEQAPPANPQHGRRTPEGAWVCAK